MCSGCLGKQQHNHPKLTHGAVVDNPLHCVLHLHRNDTSTRRYEGRGSHIVGEAVQVAEDVGLHRCHKRAVRHLHASTAFIHQVQSPRIKVMVGILSIAGARVTSTGSKHPETCIWSSLDAVQQSKPTSCRTRFAARLCATERNEPGLHLAPGWYRTTQAAERSRCIQAATRQPTRHM